MQEYTWKGFPMTLFRLKKKLKTWHACSTITNDWVVTSSMLCEISVLFRILKKTCSGLLTFAHPNNNRISLLDIWKTSKRRIFPYDCSAIHNATNLSKFSFVKWQYLGNVGCKVMIKSTVKNWGFRNRCSFRVSSPP